MSSKKLVEKNHCSSKRITNNIALSLLIHWQKCVIKKSGEMATFTTTQKAIAIIPHFSSTLSLVGSGERALVSY